MPDRTLVRLVPRETTPARPVGRPDSVPAPVIPLATAGRVIHPVDLPPGAAVPVRREVPGRLARALMALEHTPR